MWVMCRAGCFERGGASWITLLRVAWLCLYILCRAALCVCVCLCEFVCVVSSVGRPIRCLVCRPSHLCVCRVGTPPAREYIDR